MKWIPAAICPSCKGIRGEGLNRVPATLSDSSLPWGLCYHPWMPHTVHSQWYASACSDINIILDDQCKRRAWYIAGLHSNDCGPLTENNENQLFAFMLSKRNFTLRLVPLANYKIACDEGNEARSGLCRAILCSGPWWFYRRGVFWSRSSTGIIPPSPTFQSMYSWLI